LSHYIGCVLLWRLDVGSGDTSSLTYVFCQMYVIFSQYTLWGGILK
jgi:hypothetical protein